MGVPFPSAAREVNVAGLITPDGRYHLWGCPEDLPKHNHLHHQVQLKHQEE
jgi:hypothetical protein